MKEIKPTPTRPKQVNGIRKTLRLSYLWRKRTFIEAIALLFIVVFNGISFAANASTPQTAVSSVATETSSNKKMILQLNKNYYWVTDASIEEKDVLKKTDTSPAIVDGRTMIPVRLISETLGATVNWEATTKIITITKDSTIIDLTLGSTLMTVNSNGNAQQITLDVPAQVNKDGRTVIPVRAVSEAFNIPVQWEENQQMVLVGYTPEEATAYHDAVNLEANSIALQYMAGGEFTNPLDSGISAIKDNESGAVVVYADGRKVIDENTFSKIRGNLKEDDMVYVLNGDSYVFTAENLKPENTTITKFDANGQETTITYTPKGSCYYGHFSFDKDSICISSNNRIIAEVSGSKVVELSNDVILGTQKQRIGKNLWSLYDGVYNQQSNPFNLDINEINKYLNTDSDEGFKSFQIAKGEKESFIMITGGEYGLNELYVKTVKKSVKRFDEIDPNIMTEIVKKNGLQVVTYDLPPNPMFKKYYGYASTYLKHDFGEVIYINQNLRTKYLSEYSMDKLVEIIYPEVMEVLAMESRALSDLNDASFKNNLNKTESDKAVWFLEKIVEKYKDKLTQTEYILMSTDAKNNIDAYKKK